MISGRFWRKSTALEPLFRPPNCSGVFGITGDANGRNAVSGGVFRDAGAGVQRAAGPLWLGAGAAAHCWGQGVRVASGDLCSKAAKAPTEAEAETKAHWQVKGGSHYRVKGEAPCPGKVDACVNLYWVLPDAKFAGFAASPPLPRPQNIFAGRRKSV